MAIKPEGQSLTLVEQIIEDPASGLTLQIKAADDGTARLYIYGDLPYGNRELVFDKNGVFGAAGTALVSKCRATWLQEIT